MAINLFNVDRSLSIKNAPVKNQCSRDYFYGDDLRLERALQSSEGSYAQGLSIILKPGYCLAEEQRQLLLRFWLLQHLRTEAASRRALEMSAEMVKVVGSPIEGFSPSIKEAVQMAMRTFVQNIDVVDDLKVCLIRNRTTLPFFTSDDPAVLTNRWSMEDDRTSFRSFGLHSAGALLFLPLSPRVLCLAYDGDVYSVPHSGGWVEAKCERDIHAYNQHQYFNCRANVYFHDWDYFHRVKQDYDSVSTLRPKERHQISYAIYDRTVNGWDRFQVIDRSTAGNHEEALINTRTVFANPSNWPRQITLRNKGAVYTNGTGVGYVRHGSIDRLRSGGFRKVRAN